MLYQTLSDTYVDGAVQSSAQGVMIGALAVMPDASARMEGLVIKYLGETDDRFSRFAEYICVREGAGFKWMPAGTEGSQIDAYTRDESDRTFATKTELTDGLSGKAPAGDYATKAEIPDVSGLATRDALTSGLAGKQDAGDYVTETEYSERIAVSSTEPTATEGMIWVDISE